MPIRIALVLTLLGVNACRWGHRSLYAGASVEQFDQYYKVRHGTRTVFEFCEGRFFPMPDAFSGFCFALAAEPAVMLPGTVVAFPSQGVETFLWQIHAPARHLTTNVQGQMTIEEVSRSAIVARLAAHAVTPEDKWWQWEHSGTIRFPVELVVGDDRQEPF